MKRLEKLKNIVKEKKNEDFFIVFERFDPDAAGSAFGLSYLIENYLRKEDKKETLIFGPTSTGFEDSKAIINKYDLKSKINDPGTIPKEANNIILVDANTLDDDKTPKEIQNKKPLIIIDHHKSDKLKKAKGINWIDTSAGATSTMIIELLSAANASFDEEYKFIAILLAMGIITDTRGQNLASERDRKALKWIKQFITDADLQQFNTPKSPEFLRKLGAALYYHEMKDSKFVSGVGFISSANSDKLAEVADYLLDEMLEGVSLLVIWGIDKNSKKVIGKGRSTNLSIDLKEFLQKRFGSQSGAKRAPDDRGEGGFSINFDLPFLIPETEEETQAVIKKYMETMVFSEDIRFEDAST